MCASYCERINWWIRWQIKWWNQCHGQRFPGSRRGGFCNGDIQWDAGWYHENNTFAPKKMLLNWSNSTVNWVIFTFTKIICSYICYETMTTQTKAKTTHCIGNKGNEMCGGMRSFVAIRNANEIVLEMYARLIHAVNWSIHIIRDSIDEVPSVLKQNGSTTTNYGSHAIQFNLANGLSGIPCENDLFANKNIFTMLHLLFALCWKKMAVVPAAIAAAGRCYSFSGRATCVSYGVFSW